MPFIVTVVLGFFAMSGFLAWLFIIFLYFGWAKIYDEDISGFNLDMLHHAFTEGFFDQWGPYNEADAEKVIADCDRCWEESDTRKVFLEVRGAP